MNLHDGSRFDYHIDFDLGLALLAQTVLFVQIDDLLVGEFEKDNVLQDSGEQEEVYPER